MGEAVRKNENPGQRDQGVKSQTQTPNSDNVGEDGWVDVVAVHSPPPIHYIFF